MGVMRVPRVWRDGLGVGLGRRGGRGGVGSELADDRGPLAEAVGEAFTARRVAHGFSQTRRCETHSSVVVSDAANRASVIRTRPLSPFHSVSYSNSIR